MRENIPISTGKFAERAMLGDTGYEKKLEKEAWKRKQRNKEMFSSVTIGEGFILAERMQPCKDPTKPDRPFPSELRTHLIEQLKLRELTELDEKEVKYYTAVGCAPLDDYAGVDAYFRVQMPDGERIVTMDMSLRDKSREKLQADVFFQVEDGVEIGSPEWKKLIASTGNTLAEKLMSTEELQMEKEGIMNDRVPAMPNEKRIADKYNISSKTF